MCCRSPISPVNHSHGIDTVDRNTEAHPFLRPDAQVPEEILLAKVEALKTLEEDYSQPHRQEPDIFRADDALA